MTVRHIEPLTLHGSAWIGDKPLFAALRLTLAEGAWSALLGPSGVGKTTLLRLIAGLPTGVRFKGQVGGARPVALMAQDAGLLPWLTVMDNVTLGARLRGAAPDRDRGRHLLIRVGLGDLADRPPAALSGGQRQRVALVRTLMEDRDPVLLDEPFSALDIRARLAMQDLAADLLRGKTVLMVTHDPAEAARLSDHIVLLDEAGLHPHPAPASPAPRPPDAPDVLAVQAALIARLTAGAA
ncbi:MAG TPA: ATP-binding cassette domain-containing protein [Paenirhodobacter sp.]